MAEGSAARRAALSACVMGRDAERTLGACLRSLAFADELVVVIDDKSTDRSDEIAHALATRVERHPYAGDVEQKRYVTSLARHDWVLYLDADESLSPELTASVQAVLEQAAAGRSAAAGYELDRVTWHLGRWIRHGDWHPDWKLRLFDRRRARWVGLNPHGRPEVDGAVARLAGELRHDSYRDLADHLARVQRHSSDAARALHESGRRFRLVDLVLRPPARFLRAYLLKRGFLDGLPGLVVAVLVGVGVFLKYAKLWELERGADAPRP